MKGFLLFVVVFILLAQLVRFFYKGDPAFERIVYQQVNPFSAPLDSSEVIWERAKNFLEIHRRIIAAGDPVISDSLIRVPYATSFEKGNAIRIERTVVHDSVLMTCRWWYSGKVSEEGGKEIALYLQKGIWRYDRRK